jgi:hypothetical protein
MKKLIELLSAIIILGLFFINLKAQDTRFDESVLSEKGSAAYQILLNIDLFSIGGVGYSGDTTEGEIAFLDLLEEQEALPAFRSLTLSATVEGGLYGLAALEYLNCDCAEVFENFRIVRLSDENKESFSYAGGCTAATFDAENEHRKPVLEYLIEGIENGKLNDLIDFRRKVRQQHKFSETK